MRSLLPNSHYGASMTALSAMYIRGLCSLVYGYLQALMSWSASAIAAC
jgi:hypothetical protein